MRDGAVHHLTKRLSFASLSLALFAAVCCLGCAVSENPGLSALVTARQPHGSRRGLQQAQSLTWKVVQVLDFGAFYNAAIEAADANARIRIIVQNHIVANGLTLNAVIRGTLIQGGAAGTLTFP